MNTNPQVKRKTGNEKEILDFFSMLEDKFENNSEKLQNFIEIFNKYNNSNEDDVLVKLREVLAEYPVLILELNKMLPKSCRLPLVNQENADHFLIKVKEKDEYVFKEMLKLLFNFKKGDLTQEKLINKFEEMLLKFPDLLEEAYLFLDYKRKNLMNKLSIARTEQRRGLESKGHFLKSKENATPLKIQSNPEYHYFDSLRNLFDPEIFKTLMKLLHLFNEGILSHAEFIDLTEPIFVNHSDLFEYLKTLTYSKMMNRRQYSLINKPLAELDLTKSQRICTSYSELPKGYPNLICSGRSEEISKLLNDRFISIPAGSEDDKNPLKKNHYEEHIFKFEDQRYEVDMIIEILKFVVEELVTLNENVLANNLENVELEKSLGSSTLRFIAFFYKEYSSQVLTGIKSHPKESIPIVINRFKKRIEEAQNQKVELEKNIKLSFDRFYYKSFDHKSFKIRNSEKKSNNAKAFIKELSVRKKDKLLTTNLNMLKGGVDNFEFFYSIKLKIVKDNISRIIKGEEDPILFNNISAVDLSNISLKKKLPDMRLIIDNLEIFKITISLIFYQIFHTNSGEANKTAECLTLLFENVFKLKVGNLVNSFVSSSLNTEKELNYLDIIDKIKSKNADQKEVEKYYNINLFSELITNINTHLNLSNVDNINKDNSSFPVYSDQDNHSEISLTPSLQSQDSGKTYKEIIILDENNKTSTQTNNENNSMFIPNNDNNHILFYANENCYVLIRFIFCIYERINKLYEYSISTSTDQFSKNPTNSLNSDNLAVFRNFIVIYKALIHKKIDNISVYEELCREVLGNESYFLFNLDKLINSLIKTVSSINNDTFSKEILNLFIYEKNRKNTVCESLYFSNYIKLGDLTSNSCYRMLFSPKFNILTIHLTEFSNESRKDYLESFKDFIEVNLQESYSKLEEESRNQDEPFTMFLGRNRKLMMKRRECLKPDYSENNLISRFDFTTKKLKFLKSGCDVLAFNKKPFDKKERAKFIFKRNLSIRNWNEGKIYGYANK